MTRCEPTQPQRDTINRAQDALLRSRQRAAQHGDADEVGYLRGIVRQLLDLIDQLTGEAAPA